MSSTHQTSTLDRALSWTSSLNSLDHSSTSSAFTLTGATHTMSSNSRSSRGRNPTPPLTSFATVNVSKYLKANDVAAYDLRILCDKRGVEHNSSKNRVWLLQLLKDHDRDTLYGVLNNVDAVGSTSAMPATKENEPMSLPESGVPQEEKSTGKRKRDSDSEEGIASPATNKKLRRSQGASLRLLKPSKDILEPEKATEKPALEAPAIKNQLQDADTESSKAVANKAKSNLEKRKLEVMEDDCISPRVLKKPKVEERKESTRPLLKAEDSRQSHAAESKAPTSASPGTHGLAKGPKLARPSPCNTTKLMSRDPNVSLKCPNAGTLQLTTAKQQDNLHKQSSQRPASSILTGAGNQTSSAGRDHPKQVPQTAVRTVEVVKTPQSTASHVVKTSNPPRPFSFFSGAAQKSPSAPPRKSKSNRPLLPWEISSAPRGIYGEIQH